MVLHWMVLVTTLAGQAGTPAQPPVADAARTPKPGENARVMNLQKAGTRAVWFGAAAAAGCAGGGVLPLVLPVVACGALAAPLCCGVSYPGSPLVASFVGVWILLVLATFTIPFVPLASAVGAALATVTLALLLGPRWFVVLFGAVPGAVLGLVAGLVGSAALAFMFAELFLEFLPVMPRQAGVALGLALVLAAAGATLFAVAASAGGAVVGATYGETLQQPTPTTQADAAAPVEAVGP